MSLLIPIKQMTQHNVKHKTRSGKKLLFGNVRIASDLDIYVVAMPRRQKVEKR